MTDRLLQAVDEVVAEREFVPSPVEFFPTPPASKLEAVRLEMRAQALASHYYMAKVILGYSKLRPSPHGEMCSFLDFLEERRDAGDFRFNRSMFLAPRDHYKTTVATITRAIRRGCKDPNSRGLILADTSLNAVRFGTEISNQFRFNTLLQWVFPDVIPENFQTAKWNSAEMVLKRTEMWREPTFDMAGAGTGIESRHYDWIIADDLVTEKHMYSDTEMTALIEWLPGLDPGLLVNDVESSIDFVGSRKKPNDAYDFLLKFYGAKDSVPVEIGPHATLRGALTFYSRSVFEDGELIFPYDKTKKSGVHRNSILRLKLYDPERYYAQFANDPRGIGTSWFDVKDLRFFTLEPNGQITAFHDGKIIERVSVWSLQRLVFYDPAVSERKRSSKQALHVVGKGAGPNRYLLDTYVAHYLPDEMIKLLFEVDERWRPEFFSIEKRGFQGWVKYDLELLAEAWGKPYIPVVEYPPEGHAHSKLSKAEHIRALQPIVKNHMLWLQSEHHELVESFEFYPSVKWADDLDALAQGVVWWPFTVDEAELASDRQREANYLANIHGFGQTEIRLLGDGRPQESVFNEAEFLASLDATGYGVRN